MASFRTENGLTQTDQSDIDIKTEAEEFEEDYDNNWHGITTGNGTLTEAMEDTTLQHKAMESTNGFEDGSNFGDSSTANSLEGFPPCIVKMEVTSPKSDDPDYLDNSKRFNLRKRKPSDSPLPPEGETGEDGTKIKKQKKKIQYNYTASMLHEALDLVQSQNISIMNAAKQYGIPRSTLRRYALTVWAAATPKAKNRPETALTPPEEAHLVSMITKMSRAGKYVSTMDVKSTVQYLLDESQRVVFKDRNRPNAGWVQRFRKRHRDLEIKGSGYTPKKQTPLTFQDITEWHSEINRYLIKDWEIEPESFFCKENAHRIFNLDEMVLPLNIKQDLLEENVPPIPKAEEEASEVTILAVVSAAGEFLQPLIIQKGEGGGHEDDIMPLDQNSYGISFSLAGKMNSEIFLRWLEAFDRELSEKEVQKPIVIFLDDIFSHFHISVFTYSIDNDIILLCVPSQAGAVLQPVEGVINERVKNSYREYCRDHYKMESQPVTLDQFPVTFLSAWESVKDAPDTRQVVKHSFLDYGLVPLNPKADGVVSVVASMEDLQKECVKAEPKVKVNKEPKAKKTVIKKQSDCSSPSLLIPTIKIKKLDKTSTEIKYGDSFSGSSSSGCSSYRENSDKLPPYFDPISFAEPILAKGEDSNCNRFRKGNFTCHTNGPQMNMLSQERLVGRQDGIKKCLDLMESFIPPDIIPIWRSRSEDLKNSSEIPFCMWRAVNNMLHELGAQVDRKPKGMKVPKIKLGVNRVQPKKKVTPEEFLKQMELIQGDSFEM